MSSDNSLPDDLELLALAVERLSHALRTPLGISLSLVNDHLEGLKLSRQDYEDAQAALGRIRSSLDTLDLLKRPRNLSPALNSLEAAVMQELVRQKPSLSNIEPVYVDSMSAPAAGASEAAVLVDLQLVRRGCTAALRYFDSLAAQSGQRPLPVTVSVEDAADSARVIRFVLPEGAGAANGAGGGGSSSVRALALEDRRVEALALLALESAALAHGGKAGAVALAPGGLALWFEVRQCVG